MTIGIATMCEEGDTFVLGSDVRAIYGRSPLPPNDPQELQVIVFPEVLPKVKIKLKKLGR